TDKQTEKETARKCGVELRVWRRVRQELIERGKLYIAASGNLRSEYVDGNIRWYIKNREKQSRGGKASAAAKEAAKATNPPTLGPTLPPTLVPTLPPKCDTPANEIKDLGSSNTISTEAHKLIKERKKEEGEDCPSGRSANDEFIYRNGIICLKAD